MKKRIIFITCIIILIFASGLLLYINKYNKNSNKNENKSIQVTTKHNEIENKSVVITHAVSSDISTVNEEKTTTTKSKNDNTTTKVITTSKAKTTSNVNKVTQNITTTSATTTTSTCTSKKFIWSWFRADFKTEEECVNKGNEYLGRYGYNCSFNYDDCGDVWYMLYLYDESGNNYDWHGIK